jgi:hypothetical protein
VADAASDYAGRCALIGILPTLEAADLDPGMMTDEARYRSLSSGLRRLRRDPFRIRISGQDPLELVSEDIGVEGANTSFQVHLRVAPADFTRTYNAVRLATAPVLAVSGSSPTFLGHRLWEETRIALYKQSIDDRHGGGPRRRATRTTLGTGWLRDGPLALFAEGVRLHQGTVWPWNRAIYDPAAGGHLRIEMRALPAGPTVIDMLANAAFLIGCPCGWPGRTRTGRTQCRSSEPMITSTAPLSMACPPSWAGHPGTGTRRGRCLPPSSRPS